MCCNFDPHISLLEPLPKLHTRELLTTVEMSRHLITSSTTLQNIALWPAAPRPVHSAPRSPKPFVLRRARLLPRAAIARAHERMQKNMSTERLPVAAVLPSQLFALTRCIIAIKALDCLTPGPSSLPLALTRTRIAACSNW